MTELPDAKFEALLVFLHQQRGLDFTGYKRPSLLRRVLRRMQMVEVTGFDSYVDYLEVHPEEFSELLNTILINVTSFFRDPPAWDYLREEVIPRLVQANGGRHPLRVWSAGCASGEEAYTLAMAFAEALGEDAFRERVKIYGTDADEAALNQARLASYSAKHLEGLDESLAQRYFERAAGSYVFRADLRRSVIFGRHDLVQDAPISRLDLLVCRNTLMYFNAETQARILQRFHFALGNGSGPGFLFLGRAEMLLTQSALFTPLSLKCRIFTKTPQPARAGKAQPPGEATAIPQRSAVMPNPNLHDLALEESPIPRIVASADGALALANQKARVLFGLGAKDVGRLLQDLEVFYRPFELRGLMERAYTERRAVTQSAVERSSPEGEAQYFDIVAAPLVDAAGDALGVSISFLDVTRSSILSDELQRSREALQTANEELQSSNEELETTNEELQSSNEELETTNEELQSTNEELETMNEELQSTNQELQTVNEELRQRTEEMNQLNAFLESVLGSLSSAAVVVNHNLDVLIWNRRAEDLWGLRADEVQGRGLLNLDIGLPVAELRGVIRPCLSGETERQEIALDAVNRRGKKIRCHVTCTPLISPARKREGVILLMQDEPA
ncbi:MAG TPA: CheR family methyltransferase [Burkholderiales bacterium]|nr:CheR family methyltransferase [Burkholderiales bacterium]